MTVRRLGLLRHAKSAWDGDAPSDWHRGLSKRGRRDAPRVGEALVQQAWPLDVVICSDAVRTRQTWAGVQLGWPEAPEATVDARLYHAHAGALIAVLQERAPHESSVLLVGHNPAMEVLLATLMGAPARMTTANLVLLEGRGDTWADALGGAWRQALMWRPRAPRG